MHYCKLNERLFYLFLAERLKVTLPKPIGDVDV